MSVGDPSTTAFKTCYASCWTGCYYIEDVPGKPVDPTDLEQNSE